jgi:hypothetical protein
MTTENNRCKATNKTGEPCRAAMMATGYCYIHSNPGIAAELGRAGGRKNRRFNILEPRTLPSLTGAGGGRSVAEQAIVDLYAGRLLPSEATALSSLLKALSGFVSLEVEKELKTLKDRIMEMQLEMSAKK